MINQKRLIETFIEIVQIDSPSGHEQQFANAIAQKLKALDVAVEFDTYGNVIGKTGGTGEPFMLNCHLDTVEPGRNIHPLIQEDRIVSDGTTILGADAKAGLAAILEALTSLKEEKKQHVPIDIVFTVGEELALLGAQNLDYTKVRARQGVTFDGTFGVNNIDLSAPGYTMVDVVLTGKGAHAGAEPEKGLSAFNLAANILSQLPLGRIDEETTTNIGLMSGGTARNAVPETVTMQGEIRSRHTAKMQKLEEEFTRIIKDVIAKYPEATHKLDMERLFNPYKFSKDHKVIQKLEHALTYYNLTPKYHDAGGGTDVNIFHNHKIDAVVVGAGGYNAHTTREYVLIHEMKEAAEVAEKLVTNSLS